jgi:hypothetical protein
MALIMKYPILGCTGTLYGAIHTNWSRLRYSFSSCKFADLKTKKPRLASVYSQLHA